MNKFVIIRKDLNLDPVSIESEGLTIGRLVGNDLALNHPTVSRTQAGIKEISGDYWVFNLSEANGTLLNGEQVDQTPLADNDVIQIGPFFLHPKYVGDALQIEVEMTVNPLPLEAATPTGTGLLQPPPESGKTVKLDLGQLAQSQREKRTPKGTRRLSGTGMLTGKLQPIDEQALKIFWDKRKREAGKLAQDSPLKPRAQRRLGKAQFNWTPTRDLQRPWPRSLFAWATLIVTVLAVGAAFAYKDAYSPGALSVAHARSDMTFAPAIATQVNSGSCTTCHTVKGAMNQNCAACHKTSAFHSEVSAKHAMVGLTCTACHSEHHGREFQPRLVANAACTGCHRDGSGVDSPMTGKPLGTPHGGTFGYPVTDGSWSWKGIQQQAEWERKGLPGTTSQFSLKEQFHLLHVAGRRQGRSNCTDCHTAGFEAAALTQGVRAACARCHGGDAATVAAQNASAQPFFAEKGRGELNPAAVGGPLCVSCHAQHGEEKELRASLRRTETREP